MKKTYIVTFSYCAGLLGTSKGFDSIESVETFVRNLENDYDCDFYKIIKLSNFFKKSETLKVWNR